jgi:hypothetical protein
MSPWVLILYAPVFGWWLGTIRNEGGIGLGARYLYVTYLSAQMLFGPAYFLLVGYPIDVQPAALMSLAGVAAFVAGGYVVAPLLARVPPKKIAGGWRQFRLRIDLDRHRRLALIIMALGFVFYMIVPWARSVATVLSVVSNGMLLAYTGAYLLVLNGVWSRDAGRLAWGIGATVLVVLVNVLTTGFVGHGVMILFCALCVSRLHDRFSMAALVHVGALILGGLILYTIWIEGRGLVRSAINSDRPVEERMEALVEATQNEDAFDVFSQRQAERIQQRLDQSRLFTQAILWTPAVQPFADGATLYDAVLALVPRALWPAKPVVAGGRDFITQYTGVVFHYSIEVSVGLHPIFEFYINYGLPGVLGGLFFFGILCGVLDYQFLLRGSSSFLVQVAVCQLNWVLLVSNVMAELVMSAIPTLCLSALVAYGVNDLRKRGVLLRLLNSTQLGGARLTRQ